MQAPIPVSKVTSDKQNDQFLMILVCPETTFCKMFVAQAGWRFSDGLTCEKS
jgi:hypothetical protein